MKIKETISSWLTHRFEILVRDEENFEEKRSFSYTHSKALALALPFLALFGFLGFWIGYTNGTKPQITKSGEFELKKKVMLLSTTVDSLIEVSNQYERFYQNFRKAVKADISEIREDSSRLHSTKNNKISQTDTIKDYISEADKELRKEYEGTGNSGLNVVRTQKNSQNDTELSENFFFFPPIKGIITEKFDLKTKHLGIDLVAQANESVKAVADGSIILSSWTEDTGNVIAIQHANNLVSFYKHNAVLLKKQGEFVKAGDVIAIIGNTGRLSSGPHLHFELWYQGSPINPEKFISF
ncbi:MAG: peptidoglycan DD-metalloendopeptidase family protein [Thermonemataceae bacterium]|nr:peptidoglycan DD-metalloendopeptidase family protein [Thermonemataceae bacterium]